MKKLRISNRNLEFEVVTLTNECQDFSTYMELRSDFDCIYLDFAKAFDRVSHHKLINKISNIGRHSRKSFIMD